MIAATDPYILLQIIFHLQQQCEVVLHDLWIFSQLPSKEDLEEGLNMWVYMQLITIFRQELYGYNYIKKWAKDSNHLFVLQDGTISEDIISFYFSDYGSVPNKWMM